MKNKIKDDNYNSNIYLFLTVIYVACIMIANILASKIINFLGIPLASGILVFPITYIIGDVLTEVYGYKKAEKTIMYGFLCNLLMSIIFFIAIKLPYPSYWNNQKAFETILENTPRIFIASLAGYLVGGFSNSYIMDKIKKQNKIKYLWFRTILSTIVGETLDTLLFITIGFIGTVHGNTLFQMIFFQALFKILYEVIFTPVTYYVIHKIENKENEG